MKINIKYQNNGNELRNRYAFKAQHCKAKRKDEEENSGKCFHFEGAIAKEKRISSYHTQNQYNGY